jgi:pilus assembly protein CpaC
MERILMIGPKTSGFHGEPRGNRQGAIGSASTARERRPGVWGALALSLHIAVAAFALSAAPPAAAQETVAIDEGLTVQVGKSRVLQTPSAYTDILVDDPKVADVVPLTSHSLTVIGKGVGATNLTIYGEGRKLLSSMTVFVGPDVGNLKGRLHEVLPEERDVSVRAANDRIILSGTVSSPANLQDILDLAQTFAPGKIVNMMSVEGSQQVMLSVRYVEMERTAAKDLNITGVGLHNGNPAFQLFSGTAQNPSSNSGLPIIGGSTLNQFAVPSTAYAAAALVGGNVGLEFDAMEAKGLIKTLAEPTLVAMSGDTASFLVGGEIPIPVSVTTGTSGTPVISIEFKDFGISLAFTPTILKDGTINLVVNPEVSSIDPTVSYNENGLAIPGFKVRRAKTTIEMRDGESFTIAGLISDNYQSAITAMPFASDIPVLGALFRSPNFKKDKTELVIVVTPHLATARRGTPATPIDHFLPPSDRELFLFGMLQDKSGDVNPETKALMSHDPTKGGVDGPYGHVVY